MKKMISMISAFLVMIAFSSPFTSIAKSAEFFTIGTGGPTGVYFQTGNALCKMLHKSAISADHGIKKGTDKAYRCTAPSTGGSNYNIGQIKDGEFRFGANVCKTLRSQRFRFPSCAMFLTLQHMICCSGCSLIAWSCNELALRTTDCSYRCPASHTNVVFRWSCHVYWVT